MTGMIPFVKIELTHPNDLPLGDTKTMKRLLTPVIFALTLLIASSCSGGPPQPVSGVEEENIKAELQDRSFRQFDPSVDASPRKGVVLDFHDGITLWAQYSEDRRAVNEWEIIAKDYRIEKHGDTSEITIYLDEPRSRQEFPTKCDDCIQTSGVSISIRNAFHPDKISFKLNDPDDVLPPPFPVFRSWTKFREDEIMN